MTLIDYTPAITHKLQSTLFETDFYIMNFYSALCLTHPPEMIPDLRGHYTEGNTLLARSGTKKLASFSYQIDFNKIFFQQNQVFLQTTRQLLSMCQPGQTTTLMLLTTNETYRYRFLNQIIHQSSGTCKVYVVDFKKLSRDDFEDEPEVARDREQELNMDVLDILKAQAKHRRSLNSRTITLRFVYPDKQFVVNFIQVSFGTNKDMERLHMIYKDLFQSGQIDEEEHNGPTTRQLNESNNIVLLTFLTFQQKRRLQEEWMLEFLSRIKYSSEVQKLKQNKKMESLLTDLENLRETKDRLSQQIAFYGSKKSELQTLIGQDLTIIRRLNIKYSDVKAHMESLAKAIVQKRALVQNYKSEIAGIGGAPCYPDQQQEDVDSFLTRVKSRLTTKLQSIKTMSVNNGTGKPDLNHSVYSGSTNISRPKSAMKSQYYETLKNVIGKQNAKTKALVMQMEERQRSAQESKKQEMSTLSELSQLNVLLRQLSDSNRNKIMAKYGL